MSVGNSFMPKPGRFGVLPNILSGRCTGTVANSTTTAFSFGSHPALSLINRFAVSAAVIPTSGSALTAVVQKWDTVANAFVTLTAPINLLTLVANVATTVPVIGTLTEAQRTLRAGETLRLLVTAAGTVTLQPTDLQVNTELLVQE